MRQTQWWVGGCVACLVVLVTMSHAQTLLFNNDVPGDIVLTGTWAPSGGANPFDPTAPPATSLYSTTGAVALVTPTFPHEGLWRVDIWCTQISTRSSATHHRIRHAAGIAVIAVDMQAASFGGAWHTLGTFTFPQGIMGFYETDHTGGQSCVDAVRFTALPMQVQFRFTYVEPSNSALASCAVHWNLNGISMPTITVPASSPSGGQTMETPVQTIPAAPLLGHVIRGYMTCTDTSGVEGAPTDTLILVTQGNLGLAHVP